MKFLVCLLSVIVLTSCEFIQLDTVSINEEIDSNNLILNMTDTILNRLNLLQKKSNLVRLESIKFDLNENSLNEYFSIDLKKYRQFDEQTQNQSSIVLLRTSSKKIDREYLCRLDIPNCSCEAECMLSLNFVSYFLLDNKDTFEISLNLPILVNDLNDNKPFFYQPEVTIDLNQIDLKDELIYIPLKLAADLDSTKENQVLNYELEKVSYIVDDYTSLSYRADQLDLVVDLSKINPDQEYLNDKFRLAALDSKHKVYQTLFIKYKIPKRKVEKKTQPTGTPSPRVSQQNSNIISFISALNDIEIQFNNNTSDSYDIKFKSDVKSQIFVSNKTDSLVTLAYFIVEKNKLSKKMDQIELESEQFIELEEPNEYSRDLFKIKEMRNGLYSISIKSDQYHQIVKSKKSEKKVDYNLRLRTRVNRLEMYKTLSICIPISLIMKNKVETSSLKPLSVESGPQTKEDTNFHNYLIIVSIACAVLVLFAIVCVSISVLCYCCNRCKTNNEKLDKKLSPLEIHRNNTNIMVYDVLPNGQKSLSSSSSSSCTSSNLSPVTTTTTSTSHDQKSNNPLFETHLSTEWYQSQNGGQNSTPSASSPLSSSSSCNLIKPVDEVDKYKNDLYRNSQVLYKQKHLFQQNNQNQSNYYSLVNNMGDTNLGATTSSIYQAKPINLLNNSIGSSSSPSYSLVNEVNLNSMDNLKDSIKEKMMSRLNEALATTTTTTTATSNLASNSYGQISCV